MKDLANRYIFLPLFLLTLLATSGCTGEEGGGGLGDEPVEVDLQVGASATIPSIQTKAADANALEGEQIHSLVVFIVDASGRIEKKLQPDLTADASAAKGNLESWASGRFRLTKGTKQAYAFANWEALDNEALDAVVATAQGQPMPELPDRMEWANNSFAPDDGKFLPMSASASFRVGGPGTHKIELVRLASRVQVNVTNTTTHAVTVTGLEMGAFHTASHLFLSDDILAQVTVPPVEGGGGMPVPPAGNESSPGGEPEFPGQGTEVPPAGNGSTFSLIAEDTPLTLAAVTEEGPAARQAYHLYVNETESAEGFKVVMRTEKAEGVAHEHGGTQYTATRTLWRNHIWNLNLLISDFNLTLTVENENPPIGGYPVSTASAEGLVCTLYGGGPFTIRIGSLQPAGNVEAPADVAWQVAEPEEDTYNLLVANGEGKKLAYDGATKTISGRMAGAAPAGNAVTFNLTALSGGKTVAVFPVTLKFDEIFSYKQQ